MTTMLPSAGEGGGARAEFSVALLAACLLTVAPPARGADPDILWRSVHEQCVPNQARRHIAAPCAAVDATRGYAIYKDQRGASQYLLIPTVRRAGIEDPALLAPRAPAYWQAAWDARRFVVQKLGRTLAPDDLSLAVNSAYGRSQDQLHIHIDCVAPWVRSALQAHGPAIGERWAALPVRLAGHEYRARRVSRLDRPGADPFVLVAQAIGGPAMAAASILVVGTTAADGKPGFIVLETRADLATGNRGSAEELQDHDCLIAR